MANYYNREGEPITVEQWTRNFEDGNTRGVNSTRIGYAVISTAFIGMNYQRSEGPPLIFETTVFGGKLNGEYERYTTETQAKAGHTAMVARVREANQ